MHKRLLILLALLTTFVLIGTANAEWIAQTISAPPVIPRTLGLICLGTIMVMFAVVGRTRLKRPSPPKTKISSPAN